MIHFKDWDIWNDPKPCLQQNDHLRRMNVFGPLPDGWDWTMLVTVDQQMNIWPLTVQPNGDAYIILTAQQLGPGGFYRMQLRGIRGDEVRHSNVLTLFIPRSLSGDMHWPTLPTEFSEAERRILAARDEAAGYTNNPPVIRNGMWWLWNGEEYENSGTAATEPGPAGNGIVKYVYDPELWRWVMWYTNGHINTYPGHSPLEKDKFTIWRDDFSTNRTVQPYHEGEDTFYEDSKPFYKIHESNHGGGVTYGITTHPLYGEFDQDGTWVPLNVLKLTSVYGRAACVASRMHTYGGYITQLDFYLGSRPAGDTSTIGLLFDLFHETSIGNKVMVVVNHSGTYVTDSKTSDKAKTHSVGFKPFGAWYRLRMECRKGALVVKIWPYDSQEPAEGESGTLVLDMPWLDEAVLSESKTLRIVTYPSGTSGTAHTHYIANLRMWENTAPVRGIDYWTQEDKSKIVAQVLAALPAAAT